MQAIQRLTSQLFEPAPQEPLLSVKLLLVRRMPSVSFLETLQKREKKNKINVMKFNEQLGYDVVYTHTHVDIALYRNIYVLRGKVKFCNCI